MKNPAEYVRVSVCKPTRNSCRAFRRSFTGGPAAVNSKPFAVSARESGPGSVSDFGTLFDFVLRLEKLRAAATDPRERIFPEPATGLGVVRAHRHW